jgi:tungstate transport system ATP-binding protein
LEKAMISSQAIFTLEDIEKGYDGPWRLKINSLAIPRGGIYAILGPNGAGKTTLLHLLHLLTEPEKGRIYYQGIATTFPSRLAQRRSLTMVFQRPQMLHGTVRRNVEYGLRLRGESNAEKIDEILDRLHLTSLAYTPARRLSGGEVQRVALARALVIKPEVLFLDEPTSNLDPYNARLIEEILTSTVRDSEMTIILVTHNVFQVKRIADRVAMMLSGSIIETGEKERVFKHPQDERTKRFIEGEMVY